MRICYVIILMSFTINLYADVVDVYSEDIGDFFTFINTSTDVPEMTKRIEKYEEKYKDDLYVYSEIVLMKYRVFPANTSSRDTLRFLSKLDSQWQKVSESRDLTSEEYVAWANIKTQKINYLPLRKVIKESRASTKYYKAAVKLDKENALAWMSFGISMLFTPRIVGGGGKKAVKYLEKAAKLNTHGLRKYYINLWLSQAYLKVKNDEKYIQALENAQEVFGETPTIQKVKKINKSGSVLGW